MEKVRERQMGYWFESMERMDVQIERKIRKETDCEKFKILVSLCREYGENKETTAKKLVEKCNISIEEARVKVEKFWE